MHFIVGLAKKYNADPILTFDQPLCQKVYEMQWKEPENSELKIRVLRMGGFHSCMSFLGMSSSGLREVLGTIYGSDAVPHMLSGSAISRAFRGHLTVSGVLYATIISDVYECLLQDQLVQKRAKKIYLVTNFPNQN